MTAITCNPTDMSRLWFVCTGRSGKKGHCLTIVSSSQNSGFQSIQEQLLPDEKADPSSATKRNSSAAIKFDSFDKINKSIVDSLRLMPPLPLPPPKKKRKEKKRV